jgi:hypothetical protein
MITTGTVLSPSHRRANCATNLGHRLCTLLLGINLGVRSGFDLAREPDATSPVIEARLRRRGPSRFGRESCERADDPASHRRGLAAKG